MYYDLNVPYVDNKTELQRTLNFLAELDYNVVALNHVISGRLPGEIKCAIPTPLPVTAPAKLQILRRCTLIYSDTAQNYRLSLLAGAYDILALRPCGDDAEKAMRTAIESADVDLISLDCSQRFPFYFRPAHFAVALQRGIRIELCYAPGVSANDSDPAIARRNLISNATAVIRATRGRGIVFSSEARRAIEVRAPMDVVNLAAVRGLGAERGREALTTEARAVVVTARSKRTGYHGVVNVIYGGDAKPKAVDDDKKNGNAKKNKGKGEKQQQQRLVTGQPPKQQQQAGEKRAASGPLADTPDANGEEADDTTISKRERKRRAKRARQEAIFADVAMAVPDQTSEGG